MRWAKSQRMQFIAGRLLSDDAKINRADLVREFSISVPQASIDLRDFDALNPGRMAYDNRAKCYVRANGVPAPPPEHPVMAEALAPHMLAALHGRRRPPGECAFCDAHGHEAMMPPHTPSARCESGGRPHCTCDTCF